MSGYEANFDSDPLTEIEIDSEYKISSIQILESLAPEIINFSI